MAKVQLRAQKNPVYFPLALTQFGLGLRIGEACGLRWEAVDLQRKIATIEQTIIWDQESWEPKVKECPKNGQTRFLVIPDILVQELTILKAKRSFKTSLIFHSNGKPLIRKSIGCAYNRSLKLCGIDYVSGTHLMRKTSATQANRWTRLRSMSKKWMRENGRLQGRWMKSQEPCWQRL